MLVPLLAYVITLVVPLDEPLQIGLIVLASVAGAPFLVKEVQASRGDLPLGVGLMFLLMVVTIFYVPLVLPLLLPGVEVNAWDIAKSLIVTMLIPIVLGLMYRAHSPEGAAHWGRVMNKASGLALLVLLVTGVGLNADQHHRPHRLGRLPGAASVRRRVVRHRLPHGRPRSGARSVLGLGTAQRNVAAAILVTTINFPGTTTLPFVLVASIVLPLILLPTAKRLGQKQRAGRAGGQPVTAVPDSAVLRMAAAG